MELVRTGPDLFKTLCPEILTTNYVKRLNMQCDNEDELDLDVRNANFLVYVSKSALFHQNF